MRLLLDSKMTTLQHGHDEIFCNVIIINVICTEDVGDKRMMAIDIALHCYVRHELLEHLNGKHVLADK